MAVKQKIIAALLCISLSGIGFIQTREAEVPVAYSDAIGVSTICVGHTKGVTLGMKATHDECTEYLKEDLSIAGKAVGRLVKVPVTQGQYDSLVSFTFNCGEGNLAKSTLLAKLNKGDFCGAGHEFKRWDKADGKVLRGLTRRRALEAIPFIEECK
jgi:lysozyme